jgi:hypothetical protein
VTSRARPAQAGPTAAAPPALLVVTPGGADRDGLFGELSARADYRVRFAGSAGEASQALGAGPVALLIAAPEIPTAEVSALLATKERLRPGIPVLVIRNRQAEEPPAWARRGVGVLRCPLLPEALSRSVDVVLGLVAR